MQGLRSKHSQGAAASHCSMQYCTIADNRPDALLTLDRDHAAFSLAKLQGLQSAQHSNMAQLATESAI